MVLLVYMGINYYIGKKGLTIIRDTNNTTKIIYWIIIFSLSFSFFIGRLGNQILPLPWSTFFIRVGAYWMALFAYLTLLFIIVDMINLFARILKVKGNKLINNKRLVNIVIISLSFVLVGYGAINASRPYVIEYNVDINKTVEGIENLKIVLISDLHLGQIVGDRFLKGVVEEVNSLKPDLILIPGDIIDDNLYGTLHKNMKDRLRELNATYGVYASMGNHEYIGGEADEIEAYLSKANIIVLRDEVLMVEESFYILGREDKASERFTNLPRKELVNIMTDVDRLYPIIMMDHQPVDITEAIEEGIDLQVSGHTHKGQMMPFRYFTKKIYDVDWGLYKESSYHLIVTSGVGTWGPPIRVGTRAEIVLINLHLN